MCIKRAIKIHNWDVVLAATLLVTFTLHTVLTCHPPLTLMRTVLSLARMGAYLPKRTAKSNNMWKRPLQATMGKSSGHNRGAEVNALYDVQVHEHRLAEDHQTIAADAVAPACMYARDADDHDDAAACICAGMHLCTPGGREARFPLQRVRSP